MQKTVLVTGCSSGIGFEIAIAIARAGHFVYAGLRDISTSDNLQKSSEGLPITPLQLDITRQDEREAAVERIVSERGRLDALVNNAGITLGGFLEQVDESEIRRVFEVNVFGSWAMTRACLPQLRKHVGAKIIFISSMQGLNAFPMLGVYAGSKFALEGLAEAWRHELRIFGMDVVLVEPGGYRTEIFGRNRHLTCHAGDIETPYTGLVHNLHDRFLQTANRIAGDPRKVADLVVRILEKRRPGLRYPVGLDAKVRLLIVRILPFRWIEWFFEAVLSRAARVRS
jgi:NAD(P)-dependent dehydrogenase (short-subunit alcohol dehydrogenase family)